MIKKAVIATLCIFTAHVHAQGVELTIEQDKLSYTFGYQIGLQIKKQFDQQMGDIDPKLFSRAIEDVLSSKEPAMTREEMQVIMEADARKQQEKLAAAAGKNKAAGEAFLIEFAARDGVEKTESGILYEIMKVGEGDKPLKESTVVVHYRGTLIDGQEFDSSYKRNQPAEFPLTGIIPGWTEVLQLMPVGSHWKVAIPYQLAYGERGSPPRIGPAEALVFEIELIEIKSK